MRSIKYIAIHCADTPKGKYFDVIDIRRWHVKERGFTDVGYHYVILLDGTIQTGRPIERVGAHVKNHNKNSIGICYIGGKNGVDTRTIPQKISLIYLIGTLKRQFKNAVVQGHRDFANVQKACPCFNAISEYKNI